MPLCGKKSHPYLQMWGVSRNQSLNSIHPGGVNICEHLELLGETESEKRVKRTSLKDGRFRATCLSMSHLQCDIRVWPGPLWATVSLSNSMRTNPETPKDVYWEGSSKLAGNLHIAQSCLKEYDVCTYVLTVRKQSVNPFAENPVFFF